MTLCQNACHQEATPCADAQWGHLRWECFREIILARFPMLLPRVKHSVYHLAKL